MSRILIPSTGAESWRQFLAKPDLHWVTGYSAKTLAHAWEASDGVPPEIDALLRQILGSVEPLVIIPEHKTSLPGGRRASQSDVFVLARHASGTVACTIEGKVNEAFGPTVGEQMSDASPGQVERTEFLLDQLGLNDCPGEIRYQLLHRTASALIEADRFDSSHAAMIVQSFSAEERWFDDFSAFVALLGRPNISTGELIAINGLKRPLLLGWACGDQKFRKA